MSEELRLYSLVNFYLSPIQAGIQTGHMHGRMAVSYMLDGGICDITSESKIFINFARKHETYIVLNGGDQETMYAEFIDFKECCKALGLPFGKFNEPGVGNLMTCYGAVIPASLFNARLTLDGDYIFVDEERTLLYGEGSPEYNIIKLLKSKSLFK